MVKVLVKVVAILPLLVVGWNIFNDSFKVPATIQDVLMAVLFASVGLMEIKEKNKWLGCFFLSASSVLILLMAAEFIGIF